MILASGTETTTHIYFSVYLVSELSLLKAPSASLPAVWNSLPDYLQTITDSNSFKRQLKTHFINQSVINVRSQNDYVMSALLLCEWILIYCMYVCM